MDYESEFRGGFLDYIIRVIVGTFMSIITIGILVPWAVVLIKKWEIDNTYIEGKKLIFDGTAMQLFGNYIKWWLLCIITFGIYNLWMPIKIRKWVIKHTHFDR